MNIKELIASIRNDLSEVEIEKILHKIELNENIGNYFPTGLLLTIKDKTFDDAEYYQILKLFKEIKFINCTFNLILSDDLIRDNTNIKLKFEKCKINGKFNHILCESIIFDNSQIQEYYYENVSEEKVEIKELMFINTKIDSLNLEGAVLKNSLLKNNSNMKDDYKEIDSLILKNCSFLKNFIIDSSERKKEKNSKRFKINKVDLSHTTFEENIKVKIQFCDIDEAIFYNTKFKDLADFYRTSFNKVNFERTDFEKISVFSESEFNSDLDFKYTKFLGKSIFRDTVIKGKLDLRNTIFDDDANFLDITSKSRKKYDEELEDYIFLGEPTEINVANRETARIIKNFYDSSNNIIEANRFYKLEMKKRLEEFNSLERSDYRMLEKSIFNIHKWSSNHSQNWFLAFFWIMIFTFSYSYYCFYSANSHYLCDFIMLKNNHDIMITALNNKYVILYLIICFSIAILILLYLKFKNRNYLYQLLIGILFLFYFMYVYLTNDSELKVFAQILNPFSILKKEDITSWGLIYKIVIGYLVYQLIISVRQNTRRK